MVVPTSVGQIGRGARQTSTGPAETMANLWGGYELIFWQTVEQSDVPEGVGTVALASN